MPKPYPVSVPVPVVVEAPGTCSSCQAGSGFEAKIKENPLVFVLGALAVGYFLAKNK